MVEFTAVDAAKTVFIAEIADRIRVKYQTQGDAAKELKLGQAVISRLCSGKIEKFSLAWLVEMADKLGVNISISLTNRG